MASVYRVVHVVPVGTSLLSNFQRVFPNVVEEWGFVGWDRWAPDDPGQARLCSSYPLVLERLSGFVSSQGYGASAELSPFSRAVSVFGHGRDGVLVILYSTSTCNSKLAREAIARFLRGEGYHVQEAEIRSTRSADEFEDGLVELLDKVVRLIVDWKRKGARVYVNATPGYKAEASFLVIASLLAGADAVYYMHEAFRDLVILPAIPIKIREDVEKIIEIFKTPRNPREAEELIGSPQILRELELNGILARDTKGYRVRKWLAKLHEISRTD
ncbi:CRISPR-associated protein [Desulfurococcaceae archaeon AG1]|nr:CRISPR-associated protein [Desulfurococcaceae archaeon AG1]